VHQPSPERYELSHRHATSGYAQAPALSGDTAPSYRLVLYFRFAGKDAPLLSSSSRRIAVISLVTSTSRNPPRNAPRIAAVYNVTKAAVWALVRSAAIDLARHQIRVNGVAPGVVDTPLAALVTRDEVLGPEYLKSIPLGRFADPADVAATVAFLASPDAAYIAGQNVVVDGGQTLGITGSREG
jgi:NAD(P)-dependent dehydrogenase (short-subunit alcohol dehydrogenase family)